MHLKTHNIDILYNSEIILKRKSFKIKYYIIFTSIFITILLAFASFYKYYSYKNFKAVLIKEKNDYFLKILVKEDDINSINNKKYKYKIKNINKEYYLDELYNKYHEILIKCKIDSKLIINNNVIDISIELPKQTFIQNVIKKIKKGMK